jgi:hypothetical protein
VLAQFFGSPYAEASLENTQHFGIEGLLGRINSSSYMPGASHPSYAAMQTAARELFSKHAQANQVTLEYDTRVYYGRLI